MHDTALLSGKAFAEAYCIGTEKLTILDIGGADVNGTLRPFFEGHNYISIDIEAGKGVDLVVPPGTPLPYPDQSIDRIVSSSCFEHDPCFWITFQDMCRVIKPDGYIYISAPSNGPYHKHPDDNWRFYQGAGQALAYWASKQGIPMVVEECFFILPNKDVWRDFVCVWKRDPVGTTDIVMPANIKTRIGPMRQTISLYGHKTEVWM